MESCHVKLQPEILNPRGLRPTAIAVNNLSRAMPWKDADDFLGGPEVDAGAGVEKKATKIHEG